MYYKVLMQKLLRNVITPDMYKRVMDLGVHCSVVGGAITRPKEITKRFVQVMED